MDVAAFVDASDTMFLESASSLNGPWTQRAWWNAGKDARWADTNKADDAWRRQIIEFNDYNGDTIFTRLRFRSNASRQSDGFYIDDITWGVVSSVDADLERITVEIAPQPAHEHINMTLERDVPVDALRIYNTAGQLVDATWHQHGRNLIVEATTLDSGCYVLVATRGNISISAPVTVLH